MTIWPNQPPPYDGLSKPHWRVVYLSSLKSRI